MFNLNHGSGPLFPAVTDPSNGVDVTAAVCGAIDAGLAAKNAADPPRTYLGGSMLGDPCLRKLALHYRGAPASDPEPRTRRIWQRGHWAEDRMIAWLRGGGFTVIDRDAKGKQFRFYRADGEISGGIDGVVTAGHANFPYPILLELKCLKHSSWNDLRRNGLRNSKEIYFAQVNLYMAEFKFTHCLFGAENADTEEMYWRLMPLDIAEAQRIHDRAANIILNGKSGALPPRISKNRDYYLCRMCDRANVCWEMAE
jgi:hypothetical protein